MNVSDASSHLFGHPIPADQDPAVLMADLRALRPLVERLRQAEPTIRALEGFSPAAVQELRLAMNDHRTILARLEDAPEKLDRVDRVIQLLDELDVLVRRQ